MKKFYSILLAFTIASLFSACSDGEQHLIELRLEKGKTYQQHLTSSMGMKQTVMSKEESTNIGMTASMSFTVQEIVEDHYELEVMYSKLSLDLQDMPLAQSLMNPESLDQNNMLKALTGQPFTMTISKSGEIKDIKGLDKLFAKFLNDSNQGLGDSEMLELESRVQSTYGEEAIRNNFQQAFLFLPGKPVAIGEEWYDTMQIKGELPIVLESTFKLVDIKGDNYILSSISNMNVGGSETKSSGIQMNLSGEANGEMKIKESKLLQSIHGDLSYPANRLFPDGLTMPINVEIKMEMTGE
jgi:hypothetical protein